jgi:uncharacterized OB-fold protein
MTMENSKQPVDAPRDFSSVSFYRFLDKHKLMGTRCEECGALYLPPRALCTACYGDAMVWVEFSGEGTLQAFTVVHIAPSFMIEAGYGRDKPYCSGIVRLVEGPAISAQILGVDARHPEAIDIGSRLQVRFVERKTGPETRTFLAFEVKHD